MEKQLEFELKRFNVQKNSISSVFIGGGTPSSVDAKLYKNIFRQIEPFLVEDAEITTEANPNSTTKQWIEKMMELGVNRISFGVQSFNNDKLLFLGRTHDAIKAQDVISFAHQVGIKNISLDLLYGLVLDTPSLLEKDLDIAFSLPINHLSAYALTIEKNTPFAKRKKIVNSTLELAQIVVDGVQKRGFYQYEISNFGTYKSRHNLGYWQYKNYIGIGSGAVGFLDNKRFYPSKNPNKYIENPLQIKTEQLTLQDQHIEKIFLGLRSEVGIKKEMLTQEEQQKVALLIDEKKLTCKDKTLFNNNYFLSDEIVLFITN